MNQAVGKPKHFIALDSWRGLCALMVALYHFPIGGWMDSNGLIANSRMFVDFFFVLSGFVIAANYAERLQTLEQFGKFAWLRIARLYPLHFAILLAFIGYEVAKLGWAMIQTGAPGDAFTGPNDIHALVSNLFMTQGLGATSELTWNWPSWSISTELMAYFTFAAIVSIFGRYKWIAFTALITISALVLVVFNDGEFLATYDFGLFRCYIGFFTGAIFYRAYRHAIANRGDGEQLKMATLVETIAVAAVILFVSAGANSALTFTLPLIFGACVFFFAFDQGAISRLLHKPIFTLLGALSYSMYMTHVFIIDRMANIASFIQSKTGWQMIETGDGSEFAFSVAGVPNELIAIAFLASVVAVSYATYHLIEVPCRNAARRMLKKPDVQAPSAMPETAAPQEISGTAQILFPKPAREL
ncbi:MAG: acyltransferase [Pseudomonadota bacterium]